MPKRSRSDTPDNLEYYMEKIRKIERRMKRRQKRRRRHASSSSDEKDTIVSHFPDSDKSGDDDCTAMEVETLPKSLSTENTVMEEPGDTGSILPVDSNQAMPATDPDVLLALGDLMPEKPKFGPAMNNDVARIWTTILKVGLQKENKLKLMDQLIPENCPLLQAPKLNQEITSSVTDTIVNRDKKIETEQNQLGIGLVMLGNAISTLIQNEQVDRLKLISTLSDAGRVLADLHQVQTRSRKNLVLPTLDKSFVDTIKDVERDDYLYGTNLIEKIKVLKTCQQSGQSIKKTVTTNNFNASNNNRQGNLNGPPRYNQQRPAPRYGHNKKMQSSSTTYARKPPHQRYQSSMRKPKLPPQTKPPART